MVEIQDTKEKQTETKSKRLRGTIVSTKMKDTAVVLVERYVKHPKYRKYVKRRKRYKAHDSENLHKEGDQVTIEEVKPISKDKHFRIVTDK